jgi:acyl-CoA thioester hydrolase
MRWADLDLLGHVNNVVYVDYLQEARVDMMRTHGPSAQGALAEGTVVVRHEVSYLTPLNFGFRPVSIECWVTEIRAATFTMAYEIFHDLPGDEGRRVYLRATTVLTPYVFSTETPRRLTEHERETLSAFLEPTERAPRPARVVRPENASRYPVHVRFSDVDVYGHVNNVKYFEYLQEARISMNANLWKGLEPVSLVVAQTDVDYRVPILFRPEPYDAWSWVSRVGTRSATIESLITDGDTVLARARIAIVFFDRETQRSTEPPESYLERLRSLLPA